MRYATVPTWVEFFTEKEELSVSIASIRRKLSKAGITGVPGKDRLGHPFIHAFYSEIDVRSACNGLFEPLPQADKNGFLEKNGRRYGTLGVLSRRIGRCKAVIDSRVNKFSIKAIRGRLKGRQIQDFYPEDEVLAACADFLQPLPQADKSGFFEKDGIRYGTVRAFWQKFNISEGSLVNRLKKTSIETIEGRDSQNKVCLFYPEPEVRTACVDFLGAVYQSDESGFFEKDGCRYGTTNSISKELGINLSTAISKVKKWAIEPIKGKSVGGQVRDFYSVSEFRSAYFESLPENLPQADKNNFLEKDGVRYGNPTYLSKAFGVSNATVTSRLKDSSIKPIKAKDFKGRVYDFYPESDAKSVCADLIESIPKADETGFLVKDGIRYGTVSAFTKKYGLSTTSFTRRIKKHSIQPIRGRVFSGNPFDFYSEPEVISACVKLLEEMPQADENGFFVKKGIRYGMISSFTREFGISEPSINSGIKKASIRPVKGKLQGGQVSQFYPEPKVRSACARLLKKLPQADRAGYFVKEGIRYGSLSAFKRAFGISTSAIQTRLNRASIRPIKAKDFMGRIYDFYPEADVQAACPYLLDDEILQADETGFITKGGIQYGTTKALGRKLGVSEITVRKRLKKDLAKSIKGKAVGGQVHDFYLLSKAKEVCSDLIQEVPTADETGFFEVGTIRYGTTNALARELEVSIPSIRSRIKGLNIKSIQGKVWNGILCNFYPESDLRDACAELLLPLPQADESGFFEKDNIRFGLISTWARVFSVSKVTLYKKLQKFKHLVIRGKLKKMTYDFYPELIVRQVCTDMLKKRKKANPHAS